MLKSLVLAGLLAGVLSSLVAAAPLTALPGIVVDDAQAELAGKWTASTHAKGFFAEGYRHASGPDLHTATFTLKLPAEGDYFLLIGYTPGANRSKNAPVKYTTTTGEQSVRIDQQSAAKGPFGFHVVGQHRFAAGDTQVVISTEGAQGVVIIDAVALLTAEQFAEAERDSPQAPLVKAPIKPATPAKPKPEAKPPAPDEPPPAFVREKPARELKHLTPGQLDEMLRAKLPELASATKLDDEKFLRRVSLDLIGRNPSRVELKAFVADSAPNKRSELIDRLLASPEFGANWANYWSDVISFRVPEPELTFLNYDLLKKWLAEEINANRGWDDITFRILTAKGKVAEHPEATFVGFHQADKSRLAAETTRVFLSTQIQCAECHDHKFIDLPQETFHEFAAFFARATAKLEWNDSSKIVVGGKADGEHAMPGKKEMLKPTAFENATVELGASDMTRRAQLARWTVSPENPFFAKALVNRAWARMMGRGFCEPVDEIGELADQVLPEIHAAVAEHFAASEFDIKTIYRLIANTETYQRELRGDVKDAGVQLPKISTGRLRGDEIFQSLVAALELPNVTPPPTKPTDAVRFPPPPKSTRDLVAEAFGYDPSLALENITKSMQQAMFMMNNAQLQQEVNARAESETRLAKILAQEKDDEAAIKAVFEHVLVRQPTSAEIDIAIKHIVELNDRNAAFEDLLWGLLNSAEFTTRR